MNNQMSDPTPEIIHNQSANRFETSIDNQTGYISYQERGDTLVYDHTIVPQALGGRGIGSALVKRALDYARESGKTVVPQCSFVSAYISKHPEYQDLL
ncbi:GNAT family N-acetyltransferase [Psychrobacter alimentarius]|uniref:GNAT family N-acetyltransferase n=1 Tax=Psychrobacter alimentarius TaxID=261164 RepID=UPI003FD39A4E